MPSLGIEENLAAEIIRLLGSRAGNVLPSLAIGQKHTIVFPAPAFAAISPVCTDQVKDFPQRHHFIRFGHRLPGVLIQKEMQLVNVLAKAISRNVMSCKDDPDPFNGCLS